MSASRRPHALSRRPWTAALAALLLFSAALWAGETAASGATQSGTGVAPGSLDEAGELPPVALISDTHYLARGLYDGGEAFGRMISSGDGKDTVHMDALLSALAYGLPKPSILIITGDLSFNGELESHREFATRLRSLRAAGVRTYVLPGNHDIDNPWARSYLGRTARKVPSVSAAQFASIYQDAGFSEAFSRDSAGLSYAVRPAPGLTLILLDSTVHDGNIKAGSPEASGYIAESTQKWLAARLDEAHARGDRTIIAAHHNFITHNYMFEEGYTLDNADDVLSLLAAHGQTWTLSGHIHIQSAVRASDGRTSVTDIATGSFAVNPHNCAIIRYDKKGDCFHYDAVPVDVERWAAAAGVKDPVLRGYSSWSAGYFGGFAERLMDSLIKADGASLSAGQAAALRSFLSELNISFFAGRVEGAERTRLLDSEGFRLLKSLPPSFLSLYADSILSDPPELDSSHLVLKAAPLR